METLTPKQQLAIFKRLMGYLKRYHKIIVLAFILIGLGVGTDLMGPLIQKTIIDDYVVIENFDMPVIAKWIGLYIFLSVVHSILKYYGTLYFHKIGNVITKDIRLDLFKSLQGLGMRYFDQTPVGSIVSRVTNDTEGIREMFIHVISVILTNVVVIIGIVIVMYRLNALLATIFVMFIPVAIFFVWVYQKYSTKYYQMAREKNSQINTRISESISGMKIIQEFNQQKRMIKEFSQLNNEYYEASYMNMKIDALLLSPVIHILTMIAIAILLSYTGLQSFNGQVIVGTTMAFVELIYRFFDPLFQIMDRLSIYQEALVSSERVFRIIDHQEVTPQQNEGADAEMKDGKIEFKNITFSYDGKNNVLKDVSFTVNPGETIALVGHTGSGKSSIINVMMRFYEFYEGDILIDDVSIKDYPIETLRNKMALVLQEPFIFYGNVKDNIRLMNDEISDAAIIKAARLVQADKFISELEDGYDAHVIEGGASFSVGQKQLLSFARAIVNDPKVLILDEATANIDTETEGLIQEGLRRIREGRTTIMIAHRLSTIKDAHKILVLEDGEIKEAGNHDELMGLKGLYFAMVELQNNAMDTEFN